MLMQLVGKHSFNNKYQLRPKNVWWSQLMHIKPSAFAQQSQRSSDREILDSVNDIRNFTGLSSLILVELAQYFSLSLFLSLTPSLSLRVFLYLSLSRYFSLRSLKASLREGLII